MRVAPDADAEVRDSEVSLSSRSVVSRAAYSMLLGSGAAGGRVTYSFRNCRCFLQLRTDHLPEVLPRLQCW